MTSTVFMNRNMYRDLFAWSLVQYEGLSWEQAYAQVNLVLDSCIRDLQTQEDAQMFAILEEMYPPR